jgi:acyl-CoA thioesterase I
VSKETKVPKFPRPAFVGAASLALAACGQDAAPVPQQTTSAVAPDEPLPVAGPERPILAFGDSLLAGYGLADGEGYPAKLETALRARGINARMSDAAVSGDTTAAALQRLEFALDSQATKPDLAIVSLGGNDMLRGLPPAQARENLRQILEIFSKRQIKVLLLGMLAAPNLGKDYAKDFNAIYPTLARKYDADLVPFFLQPVLGKPGMIQDDRVHPTRLGIDAMVTATVDDVAEALPPAEPQAGA